MRTIIAPEPMGLKGPRREDWLDAKTLVDSQGQEYSVQDLLEQCRQDYSSVCLKKTQDGRLGYRKRSPEETRWIADQPVEIIQFRYAINRDQAALLKYRSQQKIKTDRF